MENSVAPIIVREAIIQKNWISQEVGIVNVDAQRRKGSSKVIDKRTNVTKRTHLDERSLVRY